LACEEAKMFKQIKRSEFISDAQHVLETRFEDEQAAALLSEDDITAVEDAVLEVFAQWRRRLVLARRAASSTS
jgi:hypothetical protein